MTIGKQLPKVLRAAASLPVAALAALALGACGQSQAPSAGATSSGARQPVRIALDYTANVNYLGIYAAIANGYFAKHGIEPQIIPYAETPAETLIRSGKTDLGISYPPQVIISRSQGLKYKAVAALVHGNTTALTVLDSSPVTSPAQLSGKLYGGFGISSDPPTIKAIMKNAGASNPVYKEVVLNTDVVQALAAHRIDYTAIFEGIDDVTAELHGVHLRKFPYRDYLGAAGQYPNAVYVASDEEIAKRGPVLKQALAALKEGYEWSAQHPAQAEQILIRENQTALGNGQAVVKATGNATAPRFVGPDGKWGTMNAADFQALQKLLLEAGVIKHAVPPGELFTNSLVDGG